MAIPRALLFVTGLSSAAGSADGDLSAGLSRMWLHWDPAHYVRIADVGYRSSGEDALFIVFFPLFPLLVAATGVVVRNLVVASLVVTTLSSVASGWLLHRLTGLDRGAEESWGAAIVLFSFPTAYALFAPYSESVFLMCVLASVYGARTGRWWLAGLAGLGATATRMVGLALVPALLVEALVAQRGDPRGAARKLGAIALVPLGFVSYLGVNQVVHGDPFHFLGVQDEHWFQHAVPPWVPVTDALESMAGTDLTIESFLVHPARLVALVFALGVLAFGWRSMRWTDRTFSAVTMLMVLSASWLISLPRYLLGIYPLFTTLGRLGRRPWALAAVASAGMVLQLLLFARFARGMWAF
ncbi:MAG TPA: mannosyltransferase family protein [Actinomycetota bacterium]|nr:mannosyltransferase family protein [Actinomycetota bacterium]